MMYYPELGRWMAVDPLAEKYPNTSLYTSVANNSINAIDPDGREIIFIANGNMTIMVHEMRHQYDHDIDNMADNSDINNQDDPAEIRAVFFENLARQLENLKPRTRYTGAINSKLLQNPPNNKFPEK